METGLVGRCWLCDRPRPCPPGSRPQFPLPERQTLPFLGFRGFPRSQHTWAHECFLKSRTQRQNLGLEIFASICGLEVRGCVGEQRTDCSEWLAERELGRPLAHCEAWGPLSLCTSVSPSVKGVYTFLKVSFISVYIFDPAGSLLLHEGFC